MKPFSQTGALHFVSGFSANPTVSRYGVSDYLRTLPRGTNTFSEGTQRYNELRDCILRESERSVLMANNCYARSLEGLRSGSAYWSLVGMYYSAFFSQKAVLGMYGCWMDGPNRWIEVVDANPGTQKLFLRSSHYPNAAGAKGSHKVSWIAFYEAMNHLRFWLTTSCAQLATTPVNSKKTWMIDTRNDVNYDPLEAFKLADDFQNSFDPANIPSCFTGKLKTMLSVSQAFVQFSKEIALANALKTDVCNTVATRLAWTQQNITSPQDALLTNFYASELPGLEF